MRDKDIMSDKDLARALRQLIIMESRAAPDARQIVRDIMRREQGRARLLAGLCIFCWLLAVAGLVLLLVGLHQFVIGARVAGFVPATQGSMIHGTSLLHHSIPVIGGSLLALLLAALCTVVLVFTSRRATLHQIQLSLLALSEQLQELRHAAPASAGGAGSSHTSNT